MAALAKVERRVLDKLEWPLLVDILAGFSHTDEGKERALGLVPGLDAEQIQERWLHVEPLKRIAGQGYRAPVGILAPMAGLFRAAALGQVMGGPDLRQVSVLLEATRKVHGFCSDFAGRCTTLARFKGRFLPLPHLQQAIDRAVGADGELLDDASEELTRIRRAKISVRKRIEEALRKLLHDSELEKYLQDDFFTVRSERYVVPMRLDGRGRVKGSILDTSNSGETLFIEPAAIAPINDQLQELDLEEKLEILRIFRELSGKVAADVETLRMNYAELIELDVLSAEAQLASEIEAGPVEIAAKPGLDLRDARHPLIRRASGKTAIGNDIELKPEQNTLIISGPNAGGKTVVLKTVGLLHLMARAGLLLPCDAKSSVYLYDGLYLEMGDAQNLTANLSTFSGHLLGLKPILERAQPKDLVLLDELAVGTDPQTGSAIGTAILEDLTNRGATVLVTTHFDALKSLAINDQRFRNGSMEFSMHRLLPTYRLILDLPGQSYGIEVAEHIGLPARIVNRAKDLRSGNLSSLDKAVNQLMEARDEAREAVARTGKERLEAESQRLRWEQEVELLKESRRKVSQQLIDKYEDKISGMRQEFDELVKSMRQVFKDTQKDSDSQRESLLAGRRAADKTLRDMEGVVNELAQQRYDVESKLPGQPVAKKDLGPGTPVFVLPLKKAGKVLKTGSTADDPVEVEVGIIKLRVSIHDLRILSPGEVAGGSQSGGGQKKPLGKPQSNPLTRQQASTGPSVPGAPREAIGLTLQTPTNSVDLRGKDADDALQATWNYIDRALLRGEPAVILIHGHGTDTLKTALRDALRYNCPYDIRFRPGLDQEGGDGVTVVELKT